MWSRSLKKRLKIVLVNVFLIALFLEIGTYLAFPRVIGMRFDRAKLQERLNKTDVETQYGFRGIKTHNESPSWIANKIVHPYMGFSYRKHPFSVDVVRYEAQNNRVVVALLGGSVAMGVYHNAEAELRRALGQYDTFAGKEIVILPMSMGGFKQPQQLMALAYYLVEDFHFDYVVNLDGYNEIMLSVRENARSGIALSFPRAWSRFLLESYDADTLDSILVIRASRKQREQIRSFFASPMIRSSAFCLFAWRIYDDRMAMKIYQLNSELISRREYAELPDHVRGPVVEYLDESVAVFDAARIWENASLQMGALCKAAGIEYLHFLQPNQYVPGSKTLTSEELETAYKGDDSDDYHIVGLGYPLLTEGGTRLTSKGIRFHNLTYLYQYESQTIYADACCHMNVVGYEIIAREIARAMGE